MGSILITELRPGTRYKVWFEDCCVAGNFVDTFVKLRYADDDDPDPFVEEIVFQNSRLTQFNSDSVRISHIGGHDG
jgi:hypothetical protein